METVYDLVMVDDLFILYADGKPCLSPSGYEISHPNARLLRLCINHLIFPVNHVISPLELLARMTDAFAGAQKLLDFDPEDEIRSDPLLKSEKTPFPDSYTEMVAEIPESLDLLFLSASSLVSSLDNFFLNKAVNQSKTAYLSQVIRDMSPEKQTALNALWLRNGAGLTVHCLLLNAYLCLNEYADAVFLLQLMKNPLPSPLCDQPLDKNGIIRSREMIKTETLPVMDFVTLSKTENKLTVIEEIIKRGEDNHTEFKSTLRWDIRQAVKSSAIEHASLKTVCAFLNSEGGDLMIGVRDDGSIEGIETDRFESTDRFLLHLWTLIRTCLGEEVVEWVKTSLQSFGHKTVCRVNCSKAASPVFLSQKGFEEAFYIRSGPGSNSLEISSALKYIEQHFH